MCVGNCASNDQHLPTYSVYFIRTSVNYSVKVPRAVALFISKPDIEHHTCSWQPGSAVFRGVLSCYVWFSLRRSKYMEFILIYFFFLCSLHVSRSVIHFFPSIFCSFLSVILLFYQPFIHPFFHLFIYSFIHSYIQFLAHYCPQVTDQILSNIRLCRSCTVTWRCDILGVLQITDTFLFPSSHIRFTIQGKLGYIYGLNKLSLGMKLVH